MAATLPPVKKTTKSPVISVAELARHNTEDDVWIAISGHVFDVSKYQDSHPGGKAMIQAV